MMRTKANLLTVVALSLLCLGFTLMAPKAAADSWLPNDSAYRVRFVNASDRPLKIALIGPRRLSSLTLQVGEERTVRFTGGSYVRYEARSLDSTRPARWSYRKGPYMPGSFNTVRLIVSN